MQVQQSAQSENESLQSERAQRTQWKEGRVRHDRFLTLQLLLRSKIKREVGEREKRGGSGRHGKERRRLGVKVAGRWRRREVGSSAGLVDLRR